MKVGCCFGTFHEAGGEHRGVQDWIDMRRRVSKGAAMACAVMLHATPAALAWDVEQIPTERGDVPLYVPSESVPGEPLPLIVSLHGFTSNGAGHENYFNLRSEIDEQRFLLAVPDGTRNSDGDRFWNEIGRAHV